MNQHLLTALFLGISFVGTLRAEPPTVTRDVVYGHKDGLAMTFDVIHPQEPNGAGVMFMVSGGWVSSWFPPERIIGDSPEPKNDFEALVSRGYTLFLVRHGSAPKYKVPDAVADVRKATAYIRSHAADWGVAADRLGAFGGSAGGHLSLMLGTTAKDTTRIAAVVAHFPPTDLRKIIGPSRQFPALDFDPQKGESVSPLLHVSEDDAPTLLIHGDKDRLVPLSHSQNIQKAFDEKKIENKLIVIEGAGHGFRGDGKQRATQAMLEWFATYLLRQDGNTPEQAKDGKDGS
ncbi:MAG TPA: alpha/beta hydrolase [Planctomycetaceae bacterium]|nr:alpha/beta hydrolase [Planctomycetaceae bacterium]